MREQIEVSIDNSVGVKEHAMTGLNGTKKMSHEEEVRHSIFLSLSFGRIKTVKLGGILILS
jgi:hypothetical protein